MTRILAIDTTGPACSVALTMDEKILTQSSVAMQRGHAEALLPMVQEVLRKVDLNFAELDAVAVTTGPGAFTGIRIGLAAARGIALAANIPAIGISVFEAYSEAARASRKTNRPNADDASRRLPLWVLIDSKRRDLFVQRFTDELMKDGPPHIMNPDAIIDALPETGARITGSGLALLNPDASRMRPNLRLEELGPPDAVSVARCALRILFVSQKTGATLPDASPLYLRAPEAKLPAS